MDKKGSAAPLREKLKRRAAWLAKLRYFFDRRGFVEVTPPCLMRQCIRDTHIHPYAVGESYLQTSPELAMKQMLCEGSGSIYAITPVFRQHESGDQHHTEFTMLEWYQMDAKFEDGIELIRLLSDTVFERPTTYLNYCDAFTRVLDIHPIDGEINKIREMVSRFAPNLQDVGGLDRDACLDVLLTEAVLPALPSKSSVVIGRYPASQSALANLDPHNRCLALRFEWFLEGLELGNGYDELCDVDEMVIRDRSVAEKREQQGHDPLVGPSDLFTLMSRPGMPSSTGMAVGIERLMMAADRIDGKSSSFEDVQWVERFGR
ncbi:MAG: amino acid--tRNA ligase-related protein [Planctomycetota bacterium]